MMTNPHSVDISLTAYNATFQAPWVGTVELDEAGKWFDDFMLLVSVNATRGNGTQHCLNLAKNNSNGFTAGLILSCFTLQADSCHRV